MQGGVREPREVAAPVATSQAQDAVGPPADDIQMRELDEEVEQEQEQELLLEEVQEMGGLEDGDEEGTAAEAGRGLSAGQLVAVQLYKVLADYVVCLPSAIKDARIDLAGLAPSPPEVGTPSLCTVPLCTSLPVVKRSLLL